MNKFLRFSTKLALMFFVFISLISCAKENGNKSNSNSGDDSNSIQFDDECSDENLSLNSIAKMNYYLGKTLIESNGDSKTMKQAYKNIAVSYKNELDNIKLSDENSINSDEINFDEYLKELPEGLENPSYGEDEIDYIGTDMTIYYKNSHIAYFKPISNSTITFALRFRFYLEDENNYLAQKIGSGTIYVVVTDFGEEGVITFRNKDKFYCCAGEAFGREYRGMYFYKGGEDYLGGLGLAYLDNPDLSEGMDVSNFIRHIKNNEILDFSKLTCFIGLPDYSKLYPLMDYSYTTLTKIEPLTLTWDEYQNYILGYFNDDTLIDVDELKKQLKEKWTNLLKIDNATYAVPENIIDETGKVNKMSKDLYYVNNKYYEKIDNSYVEVNLGYQYEGYNYKKIEDILNDLLENLDDLTQINSSTYYCNQWLIEVNNNQIKNIRGANGYIDLVGETVITIDNN